MQYYYLVLTFSFGAIMGSFFNVVIYRLPRNESIVYGSSHCPNCQKPIKAYDLIPILSYLVLKGKCRNCHQAISLRYPLIELLTAITYTLVYLVYGLSFATLIGLVLTSTMIIVAMIDIDTMEILDRFHIILLVLAIINLFITNLPLKDHIIGFFVISVPFLIIAYLTNGIGGGDIKLIAVAGLLLGYQSTLVAFFIASIIGGIVAVYLLATKQKDRKSLIAFGPYLCVGIYFAYIYGQSIFNWYLTFFH